MPIELTNRVIAITGASSGIGAATALACARAGMDVALAARSAARLDAVAEQVRAAGRRALPIVCDVTRDQDVTALVEQTLQVMGRLDVMFANAGFGFYGSIEGSGHDQARSIWETNFWGTIRCVHAALPALRRNPAAGAGNGAATPGTRGHVLVMASAVSDIGLPYFGHYCATKAAQDAVAQALRYEIEDEGIAVTSIHPIGTRSAFFERARAVTGAAEAPMHTSQRLMQTPEKVADKIVACLRRPRAELWPFTPVRFGLAVATALPWMAARELRRQARLARAALGNGNA